MIALLALLVACKPAATPVDTAVCGATAGQGVDVAVIDGCAACHAELAARFSGSQALLLDCSGCHVVSDANGGACHAAIPACSDCHSEVAHAGLACTGCHDPHGTGNLVLIKASIARPDGTTATIAVGSALGLAADGLVHGDGTGLCETCHVGTAHYDAAGDGSPHETRWCGAWHDHQRGFAAP